MSVNYADLTPGTAITWTNTGGTKAMNMKSLANAGIQQGVKSDTLVDGTKGFPEILEVIAETKLAVAPTSGNEFLIYFGFSKNATAANENPGGLTGADAAVGNADQLPQLTFVGSIVMSNSLGTGVQRQRMEVRPKAEYFIPVAQNSTGQATSSTDGETVITVRPWYRRNPIA